MNDGEVAQKWECDLLVLGASFTGIEVMHQLNRDGVLHSVDVVVVDMQAAHAYIPLVHELVAAEVTDADYVLRTAEYVRSLPRARYVEDAVVNLDAERRQVHLASGLLVHARAIVIALGSEVTAPRGMTSASTADSPKFLA
jgi:NADH:ubiquinone reductase (H+-translocating)